MKKTSFTFTALLVFIFSSFIASETTKAATGNPNANSNVFFYIPHQDDEALTFGVSIMSHVQAGHNVHVVLLTGGTASVIRTSLGMTKTEFSQARNREFALSLAIMGVKPENIIYHNYEDGSLSISELEKLIRKYENYHPNAKHKVFSYTDWHSDHKNTGIALKNLQISGVVTDARYYVRRGENPVGYNLIKENLSPYYRPFLIAVSAAYNIENNRLGLYGIGHKSVKDSFNEFENQPMSRYHK